MYIVTEGIASRYEYEKLARVFFPDQKHSDKEADDPDALRIEVRWNGRHISSRLKAGEKEFRDETLVPQEKAEDGWMK